MGIHYTTLGDLERDFRIIATEFKPLAAGEVKDVAYDGLNAGKRFARASSGTHARKYAGKFTAERKGVLSYEWGPLASGQGELVHVLERGSKNNPPHHDIAKAADIHGAATLGNRIQYVVFAKLFWP